MPERRAITRDERAAKWTPYRPPAYPIKDKFHNPWIPIDPISGMCAYDLWVGMGRPTDDSFRDKLDELTGRNER